jgi:tetratricopeptide (TPR) repeat protein
MIAACVLALAACLPVQRNAKPHDDQQIFVSITESDGDTLCTVRAHDAPLGELLRELAARSKLTFGEVGDSWNKLLVNVDLDARPLRQALGFILGSVDVRFAIHGDALLLIPAELDAQASADDLDDQALAGYLRVLREFPDHALAADAEKIQADIEEHRGRYAAARTLREAFLEHHVESPLLPEVLAGLARLQMRDEHWDEAAPHLLHLLRLTSQPALAVPARVDLIRCMSHTGDSARALDMLERLESSTPAADFDHAVERRLLRARCLATLGSGKEALDILTALEGSPSVLTARVEVLEIRAIACESIGQRAQAAQAWLAISRAVEGEPRTHALERAAQLALDDGDELGALFVDKLASHDSIASEQLANVANSARTRLALGSADLDPAALRRRVEEAERLVATGLNTQAFDLLRPVAKLSHALDPQMRVKFSLAYARALAAEIGLESALASLRDALPTITDAESRRQVYVLAGELLERNNHLDEAIEAYQGRF